MLSTNILNLSEKDVKLIFLSRKPTLKKTFSSIWDAVRLRTYFLIKRYPRPERRRLPYWSFKAYRGSTYFPLTVYAGLFKRSGRLTLGLKKRIHRLSVRKVNFISHARLLHKANRPYMSAFSLKERVFLSRKVMHRTVWEFLYRGVKKKYLKRSSAISWIGQSSWMEGGRTKLFLNAHRPLAWKLRTARYAHWNLKTKGKLNEYRYDKLLGTELFFVGKTSPYLLLPFIIFSTLTAALSWRQIKQLVEYRLFIYNGRYNWLPDDFRVGDIVELPLGSPLKKLRKRVRFLYKKLIIRARRASYKNFLARKKYGNKNVMKIPKVFKKLPIPAKLLRDKFAYDPAMNCFAVIHPVNTLTRDIEHRLTKSSVLTLQNWRYRFD